MSKKQTYVIQWKMNNKYKLANKTDLSVILMTYDELEIFLENRVNIVELDDYMNNISGDDKIYDLFA